MPFAQFASTIGRALSGREWSWRMVSGGALLVALIISGVGVVMVWAPNAADAKSDDVLTRIAPVWPDADVLASRKCAECGVIESRRTIVRDERAAAYDVAVSGMARGQNEIQRSAVSESEVTVRMNDGTSRKFVDASPSNWRTGERMIFIEGVGASNH